MSVSLDQYVVKHANIAASSSGNNTVVAAVSGKQIWVLEVVLISNGLVNVKFQSGAGGTDITGLFYLRANTGFSKNHGGANYAIPLCKTATGALLNLNLSDAIAVGGVLAYIEVSA